VSTFVTSIATALILAGVFALLKSRWLYAVLPKGHLNTPFSKGHVALLTFSNYGFRTEEEVEFLIRTNCRCELLATSKGNVSLLNNKLTISRISRFQSITVVLLAEGKALEKEDVDTFESKETAGKIVEKKEQVNSVAQHLIVWPVIFLLLGLPFSAGTLYGKQQQQDIFELANDFFETTAVPVAGYKVERADIRGYMKDPLSKDIKTLGFPAKISAVTRKGAKILVEITVTNSYMNEFSLSITGKGPTGDQSAGSFLKAYVSDFLIFPKESKKKTIEILLPASFENKVLIVDYRLEFAGQTALTTDRVAFAP
jgi:hypothetical protein